LDTPRYKSDFFGRNNRLTSGVLIRIEAHLMRDPKEQELLERLQTGDERALVELADSYGSKIYQLAFRYLRNKEDAEEVTQDVLMKVYRKVGDFRGDAALSSWIYRITFNAAMSRLRTARYQRSQDDERASPSVDGEVDSSRVDVADWSEMADERVLRAELRRHVMRAVLALPAIYRAPVVLRDLQGMSTEEASAMLKVKDQTLKSRLHRGRLILRKQLANFAGGLTLHRPIYGTS
jgi:RNA polymerase sigma-70 factor, ECF subfamily